MKQQFLFSCLLLLLNTCFSSCSKDDDKSLSDYSSITVYFAYQFVGKTLVYNRAVNGTSNKYDNKCRIYASMGGTTQSDVIVDVVIDESLCDNIYIADDKGIFGIPVLPMKSNYYKLLSNKISFNGGESGYVDVQLTDAFFNDPQALEYTYAIPLRMASLTGPGKILKGTPFEGTAPSCTDLGSWDVPAKDYILCWVKFFNVGEGSWFRCGVDKVTENGATSIVVRHSTKLEDTYPELYKTTPITYNEECYIKTKNKTQAFFPVSFKTSEGIVSCNLILTFGDNNEVYISSNDENVTVTGLGEFIPSGTERPEYQFYQWRVNNGEIIHDDILRLTYNINFSGSNIQVSTNDTLVISDRHDNEKVSIATKYIKK